MTDTPPDWVLIEAAKRVYWAGDLAEWRKQIAIGNSCFIALCDMILKHEQPPVDRKLLCAEEACIKDGWHITVGTCVRAIELWEEGFGK